MDAVDVVIAPPPPDPPVPVPEVRISRLALAAADAVMCLWFVSTWALFASVAAGLIELLACGLGCTGAPWLAALFSLLFFGIFTMAVLMVTKFEDYMKQLKKGAAALEPISEAVVNAHLIAMMASPFLVFLGLMLKLNDPLTTRIASGTGIIFLALLGICVICCLVSIPGLAVRMWRMRRHGRASVVPI